MEMKTILECGYSTRRKPGYFDDLQKYPKENPIFIAVDWKGLHFIRRLKGVCLFCGDDLYYELNFCFRREIWVLYTEKETLNKALQLGRIIQLLGADKVLVIAVSLPLSEGITHAKQ